MRGVNKSSVWIVLGWLCGAALPFAATATAADLADQTPGNALLAIEWSKVSDNCPLIDVAKAILDAPLLTNMDKDVAQVRQVLDFAEAAGKHSGILAVLPGAGKDPVEMACLIEAGAEAGKLAEMLKQALKSENEMFQPEVVTLGGVSFTRFGSMPDATHVAVEKDMLIVTVGRQAAEALVGPRNKFIPLSHQPEFVQARKKLPAEGPWHATLFVNVQAGLTLAGAEQDEDAKKISSALGLSDFHSLYLLLDSNSFGTRMQTYLHGPAKAEGLAKLWRQKPLAEADLAIIPRDPYWASAAKLDLADLYQEAMAVGDKIDPNVPIAVNGAMAMVRGMLGFSPTENLLPAFGDTWICYDAPEQGGLMFSGMVLINNTRDAAGLQGMLQRAIEYAVPLAAQNKVQIVRKEMKHGAHTINYILIGGLPVPIAPAWAFVGDKWIFGLAPQTVATACMQVDAATRKQSLLDNPEFKAGRALLPRELTGVHYTDAKNAYLSLYPLLLLLKTAAASASAGSAHPYDLASVPTFVEKQATVHNMVGGSSVDAEGVLSTAVGVSPGAMIFTGNLDAGTSVMLVSVMLPSLSRAREQAKRAVCMSNMRGVAVGCHVFAGDHEGKFPAELKELVNAGICMPAQFICPDSEATEQDVQDFLDGKPNNVGWTYIAGQTSTGNSQNVLLFEDLSHHGEGAAVVFQDGHVEFRRADGRKDAVRETYKRLGREGEIPAEMRTP